MNQVWAICVLPTSSSKLLELKMELEKRVVEIYLKERNMNPVTVVVEKEKPIGEFNEQIYKYSFAD